MVTCKTRKWGNSLGIIIPKEEAKKLQLTQGDSVEVIFKKKENPLKELFGFAKDWNYTREQFRKDRALYEPK